MMDSPVNFTYEDTDTYQNEISELYSYSEESDFFANRNAFEESMEDCGLPLTWKHMVREQQSQAINYLMTTLEVSCRTTRIKSCRALAYLVQGNFGECLSLEEQASNSRENVFLLYKQGVFQAFAQQLVIELNHVPESSQQGHASVPTTQIYNDSSELRLILSVLITITETMYHAKHSTDPDIGEICRQFIHDLQNRACDELLTVTLFQMLNNFCSGQAPHYPVKKITLLLWKVILISLGGSSELRQLKQDKRKLCNLSPLLDDTIEVTKDMSPCPPATVFDGPARSRAVIACKMLGNKRKVLKQPAFDDAIFTYARECLLNFSVPRSPEDGEMKRDESEMNDLENEAETEAVSDSNPEPDGDVSLNSSEERENNLFDRENDEPSDSKLDSATDPSEKPEGETDSLDCIFKENLPLAIDELKLEGSSSDSGVMEDKDTSAENMAIEDDDMDDDGEMKFDIDKLFSHADEEKEEEMSLLRLFGQDSPARPRSEIRKSEPFKTESHTSKSNFDAQVRSNPSANSYKGLPWAPKVRKSDLNIHLSNIRQKFLGYTLSNDLDTTFGLPNPIIEGINVLRKHLYVSLAEIQLEREEAMERYPLTHSELDPNFRDEPAEKLYAALLPRLPQYMIALLKILLAASTSSKNKSERTESINIMAEINPDVSSQSIIQTIKMNADANRHKEIIIKAISAILILLLKHFKINHVYQFEYVSQQLMFANCIPLILKYLSQDICSYIFCSRSNISAIDFPACVIGEQPELTTEAIELCSFQPYCWRNIFSCINLLRVLNKLTKWKHSRIMMLVVFKSSQTLLKALNVRHPLLQLYVLKLLKVQLKFLGRQWKKNNMKLISPIYRKVRHRLTDDWAYSNDNEARPWDFQAEEFTLQANINKFHRRRYQHLLNLSNKNRCNLSINSQNGFDDCVDEDFDFDLFNHTELSPNFTRNYERWLESEVFQRQIDWDKLLTVT